MFPFIYFVLDFFLIIRGSFESTNLWFVPTSGSPPSLSFEYKISNYTLLLIFKIIGSTSMKSRHEAFDELLLHSSKKKTPIQDGFSRNEKFVERLFSAE